MSEPISAAASQLHVNSFIPTTETMVNLNTVVENLLQQYSKDLRSGQLIARCETLPVLKGDAGRLQTLFEIILSLVLRNDQLAGKQYLHIDCCEDELLENRKKTDLHLKNYCIEFKSNYKPEIDVAGRDREVLETCDEILDSINGTLQILCTENNGCFLKVLLPGKMS